MKTIPLRLIVATILIIGTVIATKEMVTLAMIFVAFMTLKFIIRTTLHIVFQAVKRAVIITVIGLILATLF